MEKFSCPNTNFSPLHWQGDSLAYLMLITLLLSYMIQRPLRALQTGVDAMAYS